MRALAPLLMAWAGCARVPAPAADVPIAPPVCDPVPTPSGWTYPAGPYGGLVGEVFEDFTLNDCDGQPVSFGDILSEADLVLFSVGAGWCQPCIDESLTLEAEVYVPFCPRGLRVVQVLYQDDESRPATRLFCQQWRDRFGLTFPVLVDPLFTMQRYFDRAQTPLNLLVDATGIIRYRATGSVPADFAQRIDALLPP